MTWLRIDDKLPRHPKISALKDRDFRVWIRVLCYCAEYRTRGVLPASALAEIPGLNRPKVGLFLELGLLDTEPEKGEEKAANPLGYVHDFNYYNDPDKGAAAVERKRQQRDRDRDKNVTETVTGTVTNPGQKRDSRVGTRARPVPSPKSKSETESLSSCSTPSVEESSLDPAAPLALAGSRSAAAEKPKKLTGWRWTRGSHGELWKRDPEGTDKPPREIVESWNDRDEHAANDNDADTADVDLDGLRRIRELTAKAAGEALEERITARQELEDIAADELAGAEAERRQAASRAKLEQIEKGTA